VPTLLQKILTTQLQVIPAAVVSIGLGGLAVLTPRGATPIVGDVATVSTAADVAALLAGAGITADGASALNAALSQGAIPGPIYVVTYATDPAAAASIVEAQNLPVGVITSTATSDADLDALADWRATGTRSQRYVMVLESRNADLLTTGKPAALDDLEQLGLFVIRGADADIGNAAAWAVRLASYPLGVAGPVSTRLRLLGRPVSDVTSSQYDFLAANDASAILPLDDGSGASQRYTTAVVDYSGTDGSAAIGAVYALKRVREAFAAFVAREYTAGRVVNTSRSSLDGIEAVCAAPLEALLGLGFFVGDEALPAYTVEASAVGDAVTVLIGLRIAGQVRTFTISVTAEVV
jgi:hypothetical protein